MTLKKLKLIIKKNKTTIAISATTSVLVISVFIVGATAVLLLFNQNISGDSFFSKESSTTDSNGSTASNVVEEEFKIVDIVERVNPAIVSIVVTKDVPIIERYYENLNPFGNGGFGFSIPRYRENGTEKKEIGGGSGFFVSRDGMLVTNNHVVSDEEAEYTIFTNDGKKYEAEVLARDSVMDIAILKVNSGDFPYLEFGNSDALKSGQTVIAIGNALGEFRNSVSVGVVSGLSRSIIAGDLSGNSELLEGVIQTDAAINPGNSGGPLLSLFGKVIGVNVAVQKSAENVGFALPANAVKNIVDSVKEHGEIIRPYLGVRYIQVTESLKNKNNLSINYGALVVRGETAEDLAVILGSPADKAGILENDIILEIDGVKLDSEKSLASIIRQKQVGQKITLKILHRGGEEEIEAILAKAPKDI